MSASPREPDPPSPKGFGEARATAFSLAALASYVVLAIVQTWPLAAHLGTHLPGLGLGDNVVFVWDFWWMRQAMASSAWTFFATPFLFAPLGTSLVLNTHTAAPAFVGATILSAVPVVTAVNVLLIASVALNGWSAWLLARRVTGDSAASFVAGVIFLMSPLVATRLMGHFNLVAIWPLTLACLAFVTWWQRLDLVSALCLGVAAGVLPFFDYYLSVYFLVFSVAYVVAALLTVAVQRTPRSSRMVTVAGAVIAVIALGAAVAIAVSGRNAFTIGGIRVSVRTPTNALTLAWLAALVAWAARWRWQVSIRRLPAPAIWAIARAAVPTLIVALLLVAPLAGPAWRLLRTGGYVTQRSGLRSGPSGIDLATLVAPPPFHGPSGASVRRLYERLDIDVMESSAYLGWAALILAASAWRRRRDDPAAREWGVVLAVFGIWSLGSYLYLLGRNTGLILPGALLRFVPIVNNARIPGRALFMVAVCASVLSAVALSRFSPARRRVTYGLVLAAVAAESLAAPLPLTALPATGVYTRIAADPSTAAVLPVPFGFGDGFGPHGLLDSDAILQQTYHRHPIAGGVISRLPPGITTWYEAHEPFATLLRLAAAGEDRAAASCETSRQGLNLAHVGFVVVYPEASVALRRFVATLPVTRVADDGERVLYRVGSCN